MKMTEPARRKRRDNWDVEDYLDPGWATDAAHLYNSARTLLEDNGWTMTTEDEFRGWTHPDHPGSWSMGAAHGQWRLNVEKAKYERNRKEPWDFYFEKTALSWRCRKHGYVLEDNEGQQGLCPSCVRYAHNRALDHGFNQDDINGKPD